MKTLRLLLVCSLVGALAGCPETITTSDDAGRDAHAATLDAPSSLEDAFVEPGTDAFVVGLDAPGTDAPGAGDDAPSAPVDAHVVPPSDAGMCMDLPPEPTRPAEVVCSPCRPPGASSSGGRGECTSDADCTAGTNGRCGFGRAGTFCSYDECFRDADCDADQACLCDGSGIGGGGNTCVQVGCRTNNDCDPGFACSPTFGSCGHYLGFIGFECHTGDDECTTDAECGAGYCMFDPTLAHWTCSTSECAG